MGENSIHKATRATGAQIARDARTAGLGAWRTSRTPGTDRTVTLRIVRKNRDDAEKLADDMERLLGRRGEVRGIAHEVILSTARGWQVEFDVELNRRVSASRLGSGDRLADGRRVADAWEVQSGHVYVSFTNGDHERHAPDGMFTVTMRGLEDSELDY